MNIEDPRLRRPRATADNPYWVLQLYDVEHVEAFWCGRTTSRVLPPGTAMHMQLPALYPGLQGPAPPQLPRPVYTPEEVHIIYNQTFEALNLSSLGRENFAVQHDELLAKTYVYFPVPQRFLDFNWQQMPNGQMFQGVKLPKVVSRDFFQHGLGMINFHMNLRSCICFTSWGTWMCLQDQLQQGLGARLPDHLNDVICYVALRLETSRLEHGIFDGTLRFWNRRFADFMLHSAQNIELTDLELSTARTYFLGRAKQSYVATLLYFQVPRNATLHPSTGHFRFFHAFLQSQPHSLQDSDMDWTFPSELVLRAASARARL